jgi:hypothetical protein
MDTQDDMIVDTLSIMLQSPVAYVRPVNTEKGMHYAVCASDGTQLALFSTQDAAYFAAKQHDLEPVLIH